MATTLRGNRTRRRSFDRREIRTSCRGEGYLNQQHKQLYLTTSRSQQHSSRSGLLFKRQWTSIGFLSRHTARTICLIRITHSSVRQLMSIRGWFFYNKIRSAMLATKIFKNQWYVLFFAHKNANCFGERKNKTSYIITCIRFPRGRGSRRSCTRSCTRFD